MVKFYVHFGDEFTHKVVLDDDSKRTARAVALAYNKKHESSPIDPANIVLTYQGKVLPLDDEVRNAVEEGADIYVTLSETERLTCAHSGCQKEYTEAENSDTACTYHPGQPKFHEGHKGWTCCWKSKVIEFEEFLKLPGCTVGRHEPAAKALKSNAAAPKAPTVVLPSDVQKVSDLSGVEVYKPVGTGKPKPPPEPVKWTPPPEVPDPADALIPKGAPCLHHGCNYAYENEESRSLPCIYHPGSPVFHEGSKGWQCCKGATLLFEDFINAPGCTTGKHKFVPDKKSLEKKVRRDFYQMGDFAIVSLYEKKVDKDGSNITLEPNKVSVRLKCADGEMYEEEIPLTQAIDPSQSKWNILSTKVELKLRKKETGDWTRL